MTTGARAALTERWRLRAALPMGDARIPVAQILAIKLGSTKVKVERAVKPGSSCEVLSRGRHGLG